MKTNLNSLEINGIEYVKKDSINKNEEITNDMEYVIIRTYSAGVFAGWLKIKKDKEVELIKARRLWYWAGAASLSQLAMEGVTDKNSCKFPCEVNSIILTEAIEIIPCTEKARLSIKEVEIWKK